ncbi:hypothetical protein [Enterococcus sp. AZ109]|uniref:hypothetical protein n=1 Tax=Enterococcus sp. AZ109 TaxID=2774634 RepID=UPI003F1F6EAD
MNKHLLRVLTVYIVSFLTYVAKWIIIESPTSQLLRWGGSVIVLIGLGYLIYEIVTGSPYFYGASQSAGSNANAAVVTGVGIGILSIDLLEAFIFATCGVIVYFLILGIFFMTRDWTSG